MNLLEEKAATLMALADTLVPASRGMPAFSETCTLEDVSRCLGFRPDVIDAFARAVATPVTGSDSQAALVRLASGDPSAFAALGLIVVSAYFMTPGVREKIGYPGQENLPIKPEETDYYLRDDLLKPVFDREPFYVRTPIN